MIFQRNNSALSFFTFSYKTHFKGISSRTGLTNIGLYLQPTPLNYDIHPIFFEFSNRRSINLARATGSCQTILTPIFNSETSCAHPMLHIVCDKLATRNIANRVNNFRRTRPYDHPLLSFFRSPVLQASWPWATIFIRRVCSPSTGHIPTVSLRLHSGVKAPQTHPDHLNPIVSLTPADLPSHFICRDPY